MKRPGLYKSMEGLMVDNRDLVHEFEQEEEDDLAIAAEKKSQRRLRAEAQVKELLKLSIAKVSESIAAFKRSQKETGEIKDAGGGESKCASGKERGEAHLATIEETYVKIMSKMLFKSRDLNFMGGPNPSHHYKKSIAGDRATAKKRTSKLKKELKQLKKSLPIHFGSSVFLRVDQSRTHVMQALITGPNKTPYDSGCFQFDIYCAPNYPKGP